MSFEAPLLAIKIDVDTFRGTREGVPALIRALKRHDAGASFFFSLGPDHTGRALRRVFRRGFLAKVNRTSVLAHYGLRTLLYGTLLPGPDIGVVCASILREVGSAGFETGIHCWDHVRWQDYVAGADCAWTEREMALAVERYQALFHAPARAWAAAGWQSNVHAARFQRRAGLLYASDTRGHAPFIPVWSGDTISCPQLPTTLATLDELIGCDGIDEGNVAEAILERTASLERSHVFTAHAELEGGRLERVFDELLGGWQRQGYRLISLEALTRCLDLSRLPLHHVTYGEIPGRSGKVAMQGPQLDRSVLESAQARSASA